MLPQGAGRGGNARVIVSLPDRHGHYRLGLAGFRSGALLWMMAAGEPGRRGSSLWVACRCQCWMPESCWVECRSSRGWCRLSPVPRICRGRRLGLEHGFITMLVSARPASSGARRSGRARGRGLWPAARAARAGRATSGDHGLLAVVADLEAVEPGCSLAVQDALDADLVMGTPSAGAHLNSSRWRAAIASPAADGRRSRGAGRTALSSSLALLGMCRRRPVNRGRQGGGAGAAARHGRRGTRLDRQNSSASRICLSWMAW